MEMPSFLQSKQQAPSSNSWKNKLFGSKKNLSIISLVVLLLAIPLTVWLAQRTQIFAPKADVKPIELVMGDDSCVVSNDPYKVSCGEFPIKLTSPYGPPGEIELCTADDQCRDGNKCYNFENYPGVCRPDDICAQVITYACNPDDSAECVDFPTPCHVPPGWITRPNNCVTTALSKIPQVLDNNQVKWTYTYPETTKIKKVNFPALASVQFDVNGQEAGSGVALNADLAEGSSVVAITVTTKDACFPFTAPFKMTNNCGTEVSDFVGMGSAGAYGAVCQASPASSASAAVSPSPSAQGNGSSSGVDELGVNLSAAAQCQSGAPIVVFSNGGRSDTPNFRIVRNGTQPLSYVFSGFPNRPPTTQMTDIGVTVGTQYSYQIEALDGPMVGKKSNTYTLTTPSSCATASSGRDLFINSSVSVIDNITKGAAGFYNRIGNSLLALWSIEKANAQAPASPTPSTSSLPTGLISYWKMDETTGDAVADSKGTNAGTAAATSIVDGKINKGRGFSNAGHVTMGDITAIRGAAKLTISGWVNINSFQNDGANSPSDGNQAYITQWTGGAPGNIRWTGFWRGKPVVALSPGQYIEGDTILTIGEWYNVVWVYDGTQTGNENRLKLYVNGQAQTINFTPPYAPGVKTIPATLPAGASPFNIGAYNNSVSGYNFNGSIDEVGLWDRALSAQEISDLYKGGQGNSYPFDSGASPSPSASPSVEACVNLIKNHSFENPAVVKHENGWQFFGAAAASDDGVTENMPDWDPKAEGAAYQLEVQRAFKGPAAEGSQYAEIDLPGVISLTQSIPTQEGKYYEVKFVYSSRPDITTAQKMAVYWNGQELATIDGTAHGEAIDWLEKSYVVTGGEGGMSKLGFGALADSTNGGGNFIDNVSITEISGDCGNESLLPGTAFYRVAETEEGLEAAPILHYNDNPTIEDFAFEDDNPGVRQIWAEFFSVTGESRVEHIFVEIVEPEPIITSLDCSMDISRENLKLTLNGARFGSSSGKVTANEQEAQINTWGSEQVTATLKPGESLEDGDLFKVILTRKDGKALPEVGCEVNTTLVSLGARLFCREPGKFDVSGVLVTLVDENGNRVNETVTIDKYGLIQNLNTQLQIGQLYAISVKAPYSIRRNAQFIASKGTNIISPGDGSSFILPVGDIAPVIQSDGKINTLDRSEIVRQWSVLLASTKTADFNRDTKVNSIDWACMRYDFNSEDEPIPAKPVRAVPTPEPTSTPSTSASATPIPNERAAYFLLEPLDGGSYPNGSEFTVDVNIWTHLEGANLFVAKMSFDPAALEVVRIERGGTLTNWTEEFFDNQLGQISITAGLPSPGLKTSEDTDSLLARLTFRSKKTGTTTLAVNEASRIYSDSDNENILTSLLSTQIAITQ